MDRTGITVVALCGILLCFWFYESNKVAQQRMLQQQAAYTNTVMAAQSPAASSPASAPAGSSVSLSTNEPERTITLTNGQASYIFTSRGGGLKYVQLLRYPETISPRWKKEDAKANAMASVNKGAAVPILAVLGDSSLVGDGDFTLTQRGNGVEAEKSLPEGLVITKHFELTSNYLINVSVTLKNESGKPLSLPQQEWVIGTATPMDIDDVTFSSYGGAMWFDGANYFPCAPSYFATNTSYFGIVPRTPKAEFVAGNGNVVWGAAYNQFFVMMAMPRTNQAAQEIIARPVDLPGTNNQAGQTVGVQAALVYPSMTLEADQVVERQITLYDGPKEFRTLEKMSETFQNRADLVWNMGTGLATFWGVGTFFAKVLLWAMNVLHDLLPWLSYGWLIVLLTILLRVCFWPLTSASMRSMKKMQALAPQVKALKEKYADDPQKFTQKQMELWRENKVSPLSGCLPMLIQTPVFIGFFTMIRSAIELRGAHFLWAADLTKTDTLFVVPGLTFIPFFSTPEGLPVNLLPLFMVAVMVWQAHMQPPSPGMDPAQQKMMRYIPLVFLLFFYNYSAGMALYLTVSTLAGILQMRLIKNIQVDVPSPAPTVSALTPQPKKKK
jgi:YidC/Oxa1 family membrane protein insertase